MTKTFYACMLAAMLVSLLLVGGCNKAPVASPGPDTVSAPADAPVLICAKCGQIKGTAECCKTEGTVKCAMCGLVKGSPGCCKLPKDAQGDVELCTKCGFIKGAADCCKTEGKEICSKCGLVKGSPGCCKIP